MEENCLVAKALSASWGQTLYSEDEAKKVAVMPEFQLNPVNIEDIFYRKPVKSVQRVVSQYQKIMLINTLFRIMMGKFEFKGDHEQHNRQNDQRIVTEMHQIGYGFHGGSLSPSKVCYIPNSACDPDYDYDFTDYTGDDSNCTRGGYPYTRPAGWKRKAVRVKGKYEDDVWLGEGGWRDGSSEGEWAVSYHGTEMQNIPSIVEDGYDNSKSINQRYGRGIYSTPDFNVAESYATKFEYECKPYKCILQNRVNLKNTKAVQSLKGDGTYFVTPNEDDIRPYGVCLKQI